MSFIVSRRYDIRFGSALLLDIELVFSLDRNSQNQSSGYDSNLIFIFDCSVKTERVLEGLLQQPVIFLNPASNSCFLTLKLPCGM